MPIYKVIRKSDGEHVHGYAVATGPLDLPEYPVSEYDHIEFVEGAQDTDSRVYGGRRILTKLEFLRLFTMTERITMRAAAKQSPVMEDYMALLDLAQEVYLDDADTVAGVQMMEQATLLATGRAAEVLNG